MARVLARARVPKRRIKDFGRWGSAAVDGYVDEVLLEEACQDCGSVPGPASCDRRARGGATAGRKNEETLPNH